VTSNQSSNQSSNQNQSEASRPVPTGEATIVETGGGTSINMRDEHTARYVRLAAVKRGLSIEIKTGLKTSRGASPLQVAQDMGVTVKRTKKGALKDVEAELERMLAEKAAVTAANAAVQDVTGETTE